MVSGVRHEDSYIAIRYLHDTQKYPILKLCAVLNINRSSYYKWLKRNPSTNQLQNEEIIGWVKELYEEQNGILGYRQMTITINRVHSVCYNKKRIRRLMQILGLKSVCRVKKKSYIPSTPETEAENVLNREFYADAPNEKWLTDVTEFKYYVGPEIRKLYLSAILDLYDKRIVAYKIGDSNNNQLVFDNFDKAVSLNPGAHPLFHSDRGYQYTSKAFYEKLQTAKMRQSMSRVGRCIDNGPMESFWGMLKSEMYYLRRFTDRDELIQAIENYIYFYNHARFQKRLHCMTPMEFLMPMRHKKFPPCYKTEREHTTEYFCFFYCLLDRGHFIAKPGAFFC